AQGAEPIFCGMAAPSLKMGFSQRFRLSRLGSGRPVAYRPELKSPWRGYAAYRELLGVSTLRPRKAMGPLSFCAAVPASLAARSRFNQFLRLECRNPPRLVLAKQCGRRFASVYQSSGLVRQGESVGKHAVLSETPLGNARLAAAL